MENLKTNNKILSELVEDEYEYMKSKLDDIIDCPNCKTKDYVSLILYGSIDSVNDVDIKRAQYGFLFLGGCCSTGDDYRCRKCKNYF